jgi:membrane protease YdiL (CAAX protease family)
LAEDAAQRQAMNSLDDNSLGPPQPLSAEAQESASSPAETAPQGEVPEASAPGETSLSGDPISLAASTPSAWPLAQQKPQGPEDLRISWSWLHFVAFVPFVVFSLAIVQLVLLLLYVPVRSLSNQKELERIVLSNPVLAVGSMVIWYALVLLFLYLTLSVFQGIPFWRSLGWRKLSWRERGWPKSPWLYLGAGCFLSVLVAAATARMHAPENVPIEELFRYKNTAMLFMAMAVLVAPLVEETVFRGYLYPLFAKTFGVAASIVVTGVLFGLVHGAQLGWTFSLVMVLVVVGIVFTFVRARTGSVYASYLLHLGYNSTIAVFTILGTQGFTRIPPSH